MAGPSERYQINVHFHNQMNHLTIIVMIRVRYIHCSEEPEK